MKFTPCFITTFVIFLASISIAVCYAQDAGQQQQQNPVSIELTIKKGDVALLDFFQLIRNKTMDASNVVAITKIPKIGQILALPKDMRKSNALPSPASLIGASPRRRRAQLLLTFTSLISDDSTSTASATGASFRGLFLYKTAKNTSVTFASYDENFTFSVFDGNSMSELFTGIVIVHVVNAPPTVPLVPITKYVRTSVGDTNVNGYDLSSPATLKSFATTKIPCDDPDMVLCGSYEIQSITVVDANLSSNLCKIKTAVSETELVDGLVIQNSDIRVYATFGIEYSSSESKRCQFQYRVTDSSGAVSQNLGTLKFEQRVTGTRQPIIYDREYRYYPTQQKFIIIPLSSFGDSTTAVKRGRSSINLGPNRTDSKIADVSVGMRPTQTLPGADDDGSTTSKNLGQRVFYITRYPGVGKLYAVPKFTMLSTNPKFLTENEIKNVPNTADGKRIRIYAGSERRFHLLYKLDDSITPEQINQLINSNQTFGWMVKSPDGVESREATATITFRENNRQSPKSSSGSSTSSGYVAPLGLRCGVRRYEWVFWNRVIKRVTLNYSLPLDDKIERVSLLAAIGSPVQFGNLFTEGSKIFEYNQQNRSQKSRPLRSGDFLIVSDNRFPKLKFVPDPSVSKKLLGSTNRNPNTPITQTFQFKITTKMGSQCLSTVVFSLRKHEQSGIIIRNPNTGANENNANVIFDRAPYGRYMLFALAGKYSTVPAYTKIKLVSSPSRGVLFAINPDKLPYDENRTSQDSADPTSDTYCNRHSCEKYIVEPRIKSGGSILRSAIASRRKDDAISDDRFWVMYRAPLKRSYKSEADAMFYDENDPRATDSFTIQFCKDDGTCASETFLYQLHLYEGSLRRIYVPFIKNQNPLAASGDNSTNVTTFDDMTIVPITLGKNKLETLVRILDFDKERRHGVAPEFRLYQAKRNGADRFNFGPLLASSVDPNTTISGNLVNTENSDENTILLVPNSGTRYQNFRFRARLYNRTMLLKSITDANGNANANTNTDDDAKLQLLNVYEDVRVIAVRENSPPKWNLTADDRDFGDVPLGKTITWSFQVVDKENDQITFIVKRAPRHADLFIRYTLFGKGQSVLARDGLRFTAPRGAADYRSFLFVEFRPRFEPSLAKAYPLNDSFILAADDGSGIVTEDVTVSARIAPPVEGWNGIFSPEKQAELAPNVAQASSKHIFAFVLMVVIMIVGVFSVWYIKKKKLLREQFAKLANFDGTEMS